MCTVLCLTRSAHSDIAALAGCGGREWCTDTICSHNISVFFIFVMGRTACFSLSETFDTTCSFSQESIYMYTSISICCQLMGVFAPWKALPLYQTRCDLSLEPGGRLPVLVQAPFSFYQISFRTTAVDRQLSVNFLLMWILHFDHLHLHNARKAGILTRPNKFCYTKMYSADLLNIWLNIQML